MNDYQKKLVEENILLINSYLNKKRLDYDEWEDILYIALCKAAINYDPNSGYKFSTFAYRYFKGEIHTTLQSKNYAKRAVDIVSLDELATSDDESSLYNIIEGSLSDPEQECIVKDMLHVLYSVCRREKDKRIIYLYLNGYSMVEIAKEMHVSKQCIYTIICKVRHMFRLKYHIFDH